MSISDDSQDTVRTSARALEKLQQLATEAARPGLEDLDRWPIDELVTVLLAAEAQVPRIMGEAHPSITKAAELVADHIARGGRLLYVGAGTPGRLAAADAAECPPTYGVAPETVVAINPPQHGMNSEAAEDNVALAIASLGKFDLSPLDVVVGIAASGRTPFVVSALQHARTFGAATIAITNNPRSLLAETADVAVELLTGPEVVVGSTRLTAGTSQKVALNILSTAAMVATGHTYGPWMTKMRPINGKLQQRAARTVAAITAQPYEVAANTLRDAGNDIELACLMLGHKLSAEQAADHLATLGSFRAAMKASPKR